MILPIVAYGDPILRKKAAMISKEYPGLETLIEHLFETMYAASGIGLAAPQVGHSIRIFIVDTIPVLKNLDKEDPDHDFKGEAGLKEVFINAKLIEKGGEEWRYNEGCLSIPKIREDIVRTDEVTLEYEDQYFNKQRTLFSGLAGRVIQHEYDHIEGILFTDHLTPLKKRLLKKKMENISKGLVDVDYKMKFPQKK